MYIYIFFHLLQEPPAPKGDAAKHTAPWSCSACTFINEPSRSVCEICNSKAPPPPAAAASSSAEDDQDNGGLHSFDMYHYNGINESACRKVSLQILGEGISVGGKVDRAGLREVIQTRFPHALVEFDGPTEPKIV